MDERGGTDALLEEKVRGLRDIMILLPTLFILLSTFKNVDN